MTARPSPPPARRCRQAFAQRTALVLVLALAGGGCTMTANPLHRVSHDDVTASVPDDYRQRHPITLTEGDRVLDVLVGDRRGELTPVQRAEVAALVGVWRREATGGLVIDVPTGTPNAQAAGQAAREIRSVLAASGVPSRSVAERRYRPEDPRRLATVRVHYRRMVAEAGPCGRWPQDLGLTMDARPLDNRPYYNLGCASQRNLAAMVAEPIDLAQPRSETPVSTARRTTVLERYRAGDNTATAQPAAAQGAVSDVGR